MAGENVNIGLRPANGTTSLFAKNTEGVGGDHLPLGLMGVLEGGGNPSYVGYFDHFVGDAIDGRWQPNISNSGTIAINAQNGGVIRFTTDSANATDYATQTLGLHWLVSRGWTVFRAGLAQVSATTARKVEIGLSDAVSESAGLAFSSASTPTAVADNAALFSYHTDESMTTYSALAVNAAGTPQAVTTGVATPSTSFQHFMVAIDSAGNAYFYTGDYYAGARPTLVARIALAVATTAVLTPWISIANTTTAAKSLDVDYISITGANGY